jgi:hypothetical protein
MVLMLVRRRLKIGQLGNWLRLSKEGFKGKDSGPDQSLQEELMDKGYTCSLNEVYDLEASARSASAAMNREITRLQKGGGE